LRVTCRRGAQQEWIRWWRSGTNSGSTSVQMKKNHLSFDIWHLRFRETTDFTSVVSKMTDEKFSNDI